MKHNKLLNIDPEEISLVKSPAVPTAKIAIAKAADNGSGQRGCLRAAFDLLLGDGVMKSREDKDAIFDQALDELAKMGKTEGISHHQAYSKMLDSNMGRLIYSAKSRPLHLTGPYCTGEELMSAVDADEMALRKGLSFARAKETKECWDRLTDEEKEKIKAMRREAGIPNEDE